DLLVEEVGLTVLFVLAFANGANDVGKSVASLMSSAGPGGPRLGRRPLLWGGVFSGLGSVSAILISGRLLTVFTPQSILRNTTESSRSSNPTTSNSRQEESKVREDLSLGFRGRHCLRKGNQRCSKNGRSRSLLFPRRID